MAQDHQHGDSAGEAPGRSAMSFRDKALDPEFSLRWHLVKTLGVAAVILAAGAWLARGTEAWHWSMIPVFWIVSNFFEWGIHRFAMHRPLGPRVLYHNHAVVHHKAFAGTDQEIRETRDLSLVMMPWYTLVLVFLMASPVAVGAALVGGKGLAGVFFVGAVTYFLLYEVVHTLHHLPRSLVGERGILARLRAQHHHHHQLERMAHVNFNVTFPLADRALGTYELPR